VAAMERRLTAQLVLSERDIVLAYSCRRVNLGPNGEWYIARLLRTENGGELWADVPLVRGHMDRIVHWGFPVWPPETVSEVVSHGSSFDILFRDEWVPFEPGGESLWRARRTPSGRWRTKRVRTMRYETDDSPMPIPEIPLVLPSEVCAPPEELLDQSVNWTT
jgi:hypothetical protein